MARTITLKPHIDRRSRAFQDIISIAGAADESFGVYSLTSDLKKIEEIARREELDRVTEEQGITERQALALDPMPSTIDEAIERADGAWLSMIRSIRKHFAR